MSAEFDPINILQYVHHFFASLLNVEEEEEEEWEEKEDMLFYFNIHEGCKTCWCILYYVYTLSCLYLIKMRWDADWGHGDPVERG